MLLLYTIMEDKENYLTTAQPLDSYEKKISLVENTVWNKLGGYTLADAVKVWLSTLKPTTKQTYWSGINVLVKYKFLDLNMSLQEFAFINHNNIIDGIKACENWAESSKQARCALYISLTTFLSRRTNGLIKRAIPCKEGNNKTFFKIRDKVATNALTRPQWEECLNILSVKSLRDTTICKLMLQGAKRVNECLSLTYDCIDFDNREINFRQSKSKAERIVCISYPTYVFADLNKLCPTKEGLVFTTRTGKRVSHRQFYDVLVRVGIQAHLPFRLTPHCFRASAITYLSMNGYTDTQIQKLSGHKSLDMVRAYDKQSQRDNISRSVALV